MEEVCICQRLGAIYSNYNAILKPLIADIEARYEKFPPALFNEIRALHDHIARCFLQIDDSEFISKELMKAEGHFNRSLLDCYKYLNVYFHDFLKSFEKRSGQECLMAINNGEFLGQYRCHVDKAVAYVRRAKKSEGLDKELAVRDFQLAYNSYSEAERIIVENYTNILWSRAKMVGKRGWKAVLWLFSAFLAGVLSHVFSLFPYGVWLESFRGVLNF